MKIFISWSGNKGNELAKILANRLPDFNPNFKPFISSYMARGILWFEKICKEIDDSQFGIICITNESLLSDYMLYEYGALMQRLGNKNVCPLLFDISSQDIRTTPFAHLQCATIDQENFKQLVIEMNNASDNSKIPEVKLNEYFNSKYKAFEEEITQLEISETNADFELRNYIRFEIKNLYKWKTDIVDQVFKCLKDNNEDFIRECWKSKSYRKLETIFDIYDGNKIKDTSGIIILKNRIKGMLAPLTLCEGNINEIKNDWRNVLNDYSSNFKENEYVLPYCYQTIWRMWGPSKEHYLNNNLYEILQFGYGDENNSIPIIIEKKFIDHYEFKSNLVIPLTTDGIILPLKNEILNSYIKKLDDLLGDNIYSLREKFSKVLIVGRDLNEKIFGITTGDPQTEDRNPRDFYSAYIWAQLSIRGFGDFAIFEHGNISSPAIFDEYVELLSAKIKHMVNKYGESNVYLRECFLDRMKIPIMEISRIKLISN